MIDIYDALILAGLAAISAGIWLIYLPAGLIAAGIAAVVWAVLKDLTRAPEPGGDQEE